MRSVPITASASIGGVALLTGIVVKDEDGDAVASMTVDPVNPTNVVNGTWAAPPRQHALTATATYANGSDAITADSATVHITVVAGAMLSVTAGSWMPNPAYLGDVIGGDVSATISPSSLDTHGGGPTDVTYQWETMRSWKSDDGITWPDDEANCIIQWYQDLQATRFWGVFLDPGYYILKVHSPRRSATARRCRLWWRTGSSVGTTRMRRREAPMVRGKRRRRVGRRVHPAFDIKICPRERMWIARSAIRKGISAQASGVGQKS